MAECQVCGIRWILNVKWKHFGKPEWICPKCVGWMMGWTKEEVENG